MGSELVKKCIANFDLLQRIVGGLQPRCASIYPHKNKVAMKPHETGLIFITNIVRLLQQNG